MTDSRQTPLYERHRNLNARMIDFAGFDMPVRYEGIRQEHLAVREKAGLFDVSHMGEFLISGTGALDLIQRVTVNDASLLRPGQAQYSLLCNEQGGIIDDLLVYRLDEDRFMLVVNASNIEKDCDWICSKNTAAASFEDRSDRTALLALQGPLSTQLLGSITELDSEKIPGYSFETGTVAGQPDVIVSATGYTGERGYELYIDTDRADPVKVWDELFLAGRDAGLQPVGLGARDTLRLEMGYALYGNDLTEETNPYEAGLGWLVKLDKGDFIGSNRLRTFKEEGVARRLCGFRIRDSRQIPRAGYDICDKEGEKIGYVTSGTQSVTLGSGIGMGYLPIDRNRDGEEIYISVRKSLVPAVVQKPPFIKK